LSLNVAQPLTFDNANQNTGISDNFNNNNQLSNSLNDEESNIESQGQNPNNNQNQNQGFSDFAVPDPSVSAPLSQLLKAPKESYNYLTYNNNQLSSEDYEFPVSAEQVGEFNLPPKKPNKKKKVNTTTSTSTSSKSKWKKLKEKEKETFKKFKKEKDKLIPEVFEAVKADLEAVPMRIFNNLFPKIFVSKTKNGGKDIEFTIGK
jgi:hypothetical protein